MLRLGSVWFGKFPSTRNGSAFGQNVADISYGHRRQRIGGRLGNMLPHKPPPPRNDLLLRRQTRERVDPSRSRQFPERTNVPTYRESAPG